MHHFLLNAVAIIGILFTNSAHAEKSIAKESIPPIAPQWQLTTQSGDIIKLSDFKGSPVILHFWATWCPYCKKLQPKLVELQKAYAEKGVKIVGISFNEDDGATPQTVLKERGYDFITAVNGDKVAEKYGVTGTPTTFFFKRDGSAIFKYTSSDANDPRLTLAVKEISK